MRSHTEYRVYAASPRQAEHTDAHLLLQTNASGQAIEGFRVALDGAAVDADFWARDILEVQHLKKFRLRYEIRPEDIDLRPNTLSSRWEDIDDLLAQGTVSAFEGEGREDKNAIARKMLDAARHLDNDTGASLRWIVQAEGNRGLKLVLQCLPRPASRLKKDSRLNGDDISCINLQTFDLQTVMSEEEPCCGPKPVLFTKDPETVSSTLEQNPEKFHAGNESKFFSNNKNRNFQGEANARTTFRRVDPRNIEKRLY